MVGYRFLKQDVPNEFSDRLYNWLSYVGLDFLKETKPKRSFWLGRKLRITAVSEKHGYHDNGDIYLRLRDAAAQVHEMFHSRYKSNLSNKLKKEYNEGLAFALQVIAFGDKELADSIQQNLKNYTKEEAEVTQKVLNCYFVAGKYFLSNLEEVLQKKNELDIEDLKRLIEGNYKTPSEYLIDAFDLPQKVADYIVENGEYETVDDAISSLAGIKINTINAYKRIVGFLYVINNLPIDESKKKAEAVILASAHEKVLNSLSDIEDIISIAYELGLEEQINNKINAYITAPSRLRLFSENLSYILDLIGNQPTAKVAIEKLIEDRDFETALFSCRVAEFIRSFKDKFGQPMTRELLKELVKQDYTGVFGELDLPWAYLSSVDNWISKNVDEKDEIEIYKILPEAVAKTIVFLIKNKKEPSVIDFEKMLYSNLQEALPK